MKATCRAIDTFALAPAKRLHPFGSLCDSGSSMHECRQLQNPQQPGPSIEDQMQMSPSLHTPLDHFLQPDLCKGRVTAGYAATSEGSTHDQT